MEIKALVVDDNRDVRGVFTELLQIANIRVVGTGTNGKEAAHLYQKLRPDIVFMDALMPDYDGFYGLDKIREHDPHAVVVIVSGSLNVEERLDKCNASAVLPKPIDMVKVIDAVRRLCINKAREIPSIA